MSPLTPEKGSITRDFVIVDFAFTSPRAFSREALRGFPLPLAGELARLRQMSAATHPAPKPLSILTTLTPAAQLLSIPRSAVSPLKLAPYPTLVGSATTGARVRLATTLASAPSIPAATTITSASAMSD